MPEPLDLEPIKAHVRQGHALTNAEGQALIAEVEHLRWQIATASFYAALPYVGEADREQIEAAIRRHAQTEGIPL